MPSEPAALHPSIPGLLAGIALALPLAALAGQDETGVPAAWEELAFLPWGDGPAEVGLHRGGEDDLAYGPHGIAVGADGEVAVIDRPGARALLVGPDGAIDRVLPLGGHPGPAAMLPDGEVAVLDEAEPRMVRRSAGDPSWSPRWAMPPSRLVLTPRGDGPPILEALDAFQQRLPLAPLPGLVAPHEPPRGVVGSDGETAVVAVRDGDRIELRFTGSGAVTGEVSWPVELPPGHRLGGVEVLAVTGPAAVVLIETLSTAPGPLQVARAIAVLDREGGSGVSLAVPAPGPVAIPADLAATAAGTVYLLRSEAGGCRLWRAEGVAP